MNIPVYLNPDHFGYWGHDKTPLDYSNYKNWEQRIVTGIDHDDSDIVMLNDVYKYGQNDFQRGTTRSVSVGDITVIYGTIYVCEPIGWHELGKVV